MKKATKTGALLCLSKRRPVGGGGEKEAGEEKGCEAWQGRGNSGEEAIRGGGMRHPLQALVGPPLIQTYFRRETGGAVVVPQWKGSVSGRRG